MCCNEIINLGCYNSCEKLINTGIEADVSGEWKIEVEFNGGIFFINFSVETGEKIKIPNKFNEDYTHLIKIYKPDGTQLENKCFKLKIQPVIL